MKIKIGIEIIILSPTFCNIYLIRTLEIHSETVPKRSGNVESLFLSGSNFHGCRTSTGDFRKTPWGPLTLLVSHVEQAINRQPGSHPKH